MISLNCTTGELGATQPDLVFADCPYQYALSGSRNSHPFSDSALTDQHVEQEQDRIVITGLFASSSMALTQVFHQTGRQLEETISLRNVSDQPVELSQIDFGFVANLERRSDWRLCAIPFRVQLNGSVHDYAVDALIEGKFSNAVYSDSQRPEPPLTEANCLRSEAWAWGTAESGLVVIKYNNESIELSVACPFRQAGTPVLRFGGAGFCLYSEPSTACQLAPGQQVTFGTTVYMPYTGGLNQAYNLYRDYLDSKGHTFPADYNPPVNWNELYDVGWYHSDPEQLKQHYTREALLREAMKARACGCEALYLDPGWEVIEGTTLWDEQRLGKVADFIQTLKDDYGLALAYRTILRFYFPELRTWPAKYLVRHPEREPGAVQWWPWSSVMGWELCLCNPQFWQEKLQRILDISKHGVRFMMFDDMDWRGPCTDPTHGHPVPTTPLDHALAVYALAAEVRRQCPGLTIEVHDPIWPWHTSIYAPTYFKQGFGAVGSYDENWGFEYMWNCLEDLRSGKALALYYYALGCNIPLYLHITMAADNDHAVFFWWAASTVRHLGIGGQFSNRIPESPKLPAFDPQQRLATYQAQMQIYKQLKPYFVRGTFHGIAENVHLHTLPGVKGGVVNVFNLTDTEHEFRFMIPANLIGGLDLPVAGAQAQWTAQGVKVSLSLPAMCPALIRLGDAIY